MGPQPPADQPAPVVMVRSIRPIGGQLYEVAIRTHGGRRLTVVVSRAHATSGAVAMAALAVALLADLNKIDLH